jgi:hypothetical protein
MDVKVKGLRVDSGSTETDVKVSKSGSLYVSQFLPPFALLNKAGKLFGFDTSGGTAKAPVNAMPTTSPEWGIYNSSTTDYLILLQVGVTSVSGTLGLGLAVVVGAAVGIQTVVAADYSGATKTCMNGSGATPRAFVTNNPTLIGGTPSWVTIDCQNQTSAIAVGSGVVGRVDGLVMCPPGGLIGIEVVGLTGTTALFAVNGVFAQIELD